MKQKKMLLFVLWCSGLMLFTQSCQTSKLTLKMNRSEGTLDLNAEEQNISTILNLLDKQEGVKIQVINLVDKPVSVALKNTPIDAALRQILGADARYSINPGDKELFLKAQSGEKIRSNTVAAAKTDLPSKPDPTAATDNTKSVVGGNLKMSADKTASAQAPKMAGGKLPVEELTKEPNKQMAKSPKEAVGKKDTQHRYVRLMMRMEGNVIKVERAQILSGDYIAMPSLSNDFVFSVQKAGSILQAGAFNNPLEMHSYSADPKGEHLAMTSKVGYFNLTLPEQFADAKAIRALELQFYKPKDGAKTAVSVRDIDQFKASQSNLVSFGTLKLSQEKFPIDIIDK